VKFMKYFKRAQGVNLRCCNVMLIWFLRAVNSKNSELRGQKPL
jgi:hypothetical protein